MFVNSDGTNSHIKYERGMNRNLYVTTYNITLWHLRPHFHIL